MLTQKQPQLLFLCNFNKAAKINKWIKSKPFISISLNVWYNLCIGGNVNKQRNFWRWQNISEAPAKTIMNMIDKCHHFSIYIRTVIVVFCWTGLNRFMSCLSRARWIVELNPAQTRPSRKELNIVDAHLRAAVLWNLRTFSFKVAVPECTYN